MESGYKAIRISARELKTLAYSADANDRVMAAAEIQALADEKKVSGLENDFVVTCVTHEEDTAARRCYTLAAGDLGSFEVSTEHDAGDEGREFAELGAKVKAKLGEDLQGRLVLVSGDGQLLWKDESFELRSLLRALSKDTDESVLVATVSALMAFIGLDSSSGGEFSGFAINTLFGMLLRNAVHDLEVVAEAFEAIKGAAERGSEAAIRLLVESISDSDSVQVRMFAAVGLEAPAKVGSEEAVLALLREGLNDEDDQVQTAALESFCSAVSAAETGHAQAAAALASQAELILEYAAEHADEARPEVIVALGAAAGNGHAAALQKLLELSQEPNEELATGAVRGLGLAAMHGGPELSEALASLARDAEDDAIRLQAVGSMGTMAQGKEARPEVVASLASIATNDADLSLFVRLDAVKGLGPAMAGGSDVATAAMLQLSTAPMTMLRMAAVEQVAATVNAASMLSLFSLETRGLIAAVHARVQDKDAAIRRAVVSCVVALVEKGHNPSRRQLQEALRDPDEHARRTAIKAIGRLATAGHEKAAELVLAHNRDPSSLVRVEVAACVVELADLGNSKAKELLVELEEDKDVLVSVAAQPGTNIATEVGDACTVVVHSYEAAKLAHYGLAAATVPLLQAAVDPGVAAVELPPEEAAARPAITAA